MDKYSYLISVSADDAAHAGQAAQALSDHLSEIEGVSETGRYKARDSTMDLGTIVTAIATSGATLAIAKGIAAWLQARRGTSITIERDGSSDSIKVAVSGIDPDLAVRIAEIVRY